MGEAHLFWVFSSFAGLLAFLLLARDLGVWANSFGVAAERRKLVKVSHALREIEESLAAGLIPTQEKWAALGSLPAPWGGLIHRSLSELRASGAALLPTLRRLRALADDHEAALLDARARSAQALSQALLCGVLVPTFSSALYVFLPGLDEHPYQWVLASALAVGMAGIGAAFLMKLSNAARWAGLSEECRPWVLAAQCAGERFLALVRAGNPADLSWTQASEFLTEQAPALALRWGASVWSEAPPLGSPKSSAAVALIEFGTTLKRTVQVSVMEGRPCGERVETALRSLQLEIRSQIDRELSVLPTRALKPLFLFVAPSVLGLLFFGMYLCWTEVSTSGGFVF